MSETDAVVRNELLFREVNERIYALAAGAYVLIVAVSAQAGYAGNPRYLVPAAAVGAAFTSSEVAAAAGVDAVTRITHQLDALCARGFIERLGTGASGTKRYGFMHPMHAELLASRAALFDQLYAAERLAAGERGTAGTYN